MGADKKGLEGLLGRSFGRICGRLGTGFHFTVHFALVSEAGQDVKDGEPKSVSFPSSESLNPVLPPGVRILVAYDEPINQIMFQAILEPYSIQVKTVANGAEVLQAIGDDRFDLTLMDIQMPELDGSGATRKIREIEKGTGEHIPIIALTAHAMKGDREKYVNRGMDDYVTKPVDAEELIAVIARLVKRNSAIRSMLHQTFERFCRVSGLAANSIEDFQGLFKFKPVYGKIDSGSLPL
ncbi:MAG: response regulator [Thermodesulfobacteriota bacterium]